MKLSIKKIAHSVLAVMVSACLAFSMTPAVAFASSGVGSDGNFALTEGKAASAATTVKATAVDQSFSFVQMTKEVIASSKDGLKTLIDNNPIQAVFKPSNDILPTNFVVQWGRQEASKDTTTGSVTPTGPWNELAKYTYINGVGNAGAPALSKGVDGYNFYYPDTQLGQSFSTDGIADNVYYLYTIVLSECDSAGVIPTDSQNNPTSKSANRSTVVSVQTDYPYRTINAYSGNTITPYSVTGSIYAKGATQPELTATPVQNTGDSKSVWGLIQSEAQAVSGGTPKEDIAAVTSLALTNIPANTSAYAGTLKVRIPLPQQYEQYFNENNTDPNKTLLGSTANVYYATEAGGTAGSYSTASAQGEVKVAIGDDANGTPLSPQQYVVEFEIQDTTAALGAFAVGIPTIGEYKVTANAYVDESGVLERDAGVQVTCPETESVGMNSQQIFKATSVVTGYLLQRFEIKSKTGSNVTTKSVLSSEVGNTLTLNPTDFGTYGISDGSEVEISAIFKRLNPVTETTPPSEIDDRTHSVTVNLSEVNNGSGSVRVRPGTGSSLDAKRVSLNGSNSISVVDYQGVFIEFFLNNSSINSVKINGKDEPIFGTSLLLGAVTRDLTIDVVYDGNGTPPQDTSVKVSARIADNSQVGIQRGYLYKYDEEGNFLGKSTTNAQGKNEIVEYKTSGGYVQITAEPLVDYKAASATISITDENGREITNESGDVIYSDITYTIRRVAGVDQITLYNVTQPINLVVAYVPIDASFDITCTDGGSFNVEIDDDDSWMDYDFDWASQMLSAQSASVNGMNAMSSFQSVTTYDSNSDTSYTLKENGRARITLTPEAGYEIGRIIVNGRAIVAEDFVTARVNAQGKTYYTFTILKREDGTSDPRAGVWKVGGISEIDKVYSVKQSIVNVILTYNPSIPTASDYVEINTSVTKVGKVYGGTVTGVSSDNYAPGTVQVKKNSDIKISFFPDDGYVVDTITLGGQVVSADEGSNGLWKTVKVGETGTSLAVKFKTGTQTGSKPNIYMVTATAGENGIIYPSGKFLAYENSDVSLTLRPNSGYEVSKLFKDGEVQELEPFTYSYTLEKIKGNTRVDVTFKEDTNNPESTYNVNVSCSTPDKGSVSPTGTWQAAAGSNVNLTVIPDYSQISSNIYNYINHIWVTSASSKSGSLSKGHPIDMLSDLSNNYFFTYQDIQDDLDIVVEFASSNEVPPEPPTPPAESDFINFTAAANSDLGNGATLAPNLDGLKVLKAEGTNHAADDLPLTVAIVKGYKVDGNRGIAIYDNGRNITKERGVEIVEVGSGVYSVLIPAALVTQGLKVEVPTVRDTTGAQETKKYSVTLNVNDPAMGSISPTGIGNAPLYIEDGGQQTFSFIPASGYDLVSVYVDGNPVEVTDYAYTLSNVRANATIDAVFAQAEPGTVLPAQHQVKLVTNNMNLLAGDYVSPQSTDIDVNDGANLSFTIIAGAGREAKAYLNNASGTPLEIKGGTLTVENIKSDMTVYVDFAESGANIFRNLTVTYGEGGTVSPTGTMVVADGSTQVLTVKPASGKKVDAITVNGSNVVAEPSVYTASTGIIRLKVDADTTVNVTFADGTSTIPTATQYHSVYGEVEASGGTITPTYASVPHGTTGLEFTVAPFDGYLLSGLSVDGNPVADLGTAVVNNIYKLPGAVNDDVIVKASFKKIEVKPVDTFYSVFAHSGPNGSISPEGVVTVAEGGSATFSILPDANYKVDTISVSYSSASGIAPTVTKDVTGSSYTLFNVSEDQNIFVTFKPVEPGDPNSSVLTHEITALASVGGGSISPAGVTKVADGNNATFTMIPYSGWKLSYLKVDGKNVDARSLTNMQYTFTNVTSDHQIEAIFMKETSKAIDFVALNVSSEKNGSISPEGTVLVERGTDYSFNIIPYFGFDITGIKINGAALDAATVANGGSTADYSWNPTTGVMTLKHVSDATKSLSAQFAKNPGDTTSPTTPQVTYTKLTLDATGGGTTSYGATGVVSFQTPSDDDPAAQRSVDVSLIADEGKVAGTVRLTYADGTVETYTGSQAINLFKKGYVTVSLLKGDATLEVTYRDATPSDGDITQPATHTVNVKVSGSGATSPSGSVTVVDGTKFALQLIPASGFQVAGLKVNGANAMNDITSTSTYMVGGDAGVKSDYTIEVEYGYVDTSLDVKVTTSAGGSASPSTSKVPDAGSVKVSIFPDANKIINYVTVTDSLGNYTRYDGYNSPSLLVQNIKADTEVYVDFVNAGPGDEPWTVNKVSMSASLDMGDGSVSPTQADVIEGKSQKIYFFPNAGWDIDYLLFNGKKYELTAGTQYFSVTPVAGSDNVAHVYFEKNNNVGPDQNVTAQAVVSPGQSSAHGAVTPTFTTVPYNGTATVYMAPDDGYTVDSVTVNGYMQKPEPVAAVGSPIYNQSGIQAGTYNGTEMPGVYFDTYKVDIADITSEQTVLVIFKQIQGAHSIVKPARHDMTITSDGGGTVSPVGRYELANGAVQNISYSVFDGYYLKSIIQTNYDEHGNQVGEPEDITYKATPSNVAAVMGAYDCSVVFTFAIVGTAPEGVGVKVISAKDTNNNPLDVAVSTSFVDDAVSMSVPGYILGANNEKLEVPRNAVRNFYFTPLTKGTSNRIPNMVLDSVIYDGNQITVPANANYVQDIIVTGGEGFELVFKSGTAVPPSADEIGIYTGITINGSPEEGDCPAFISQKGTFEATSDEPITFTIDLGTDVPGNEKGYWRPTSIIIKEYSLDDATLSAIKASGGSIAEYVAAHPELDYQSYSIPAKEYGTGSFEVVRQSGNYIQCDATFEIGSFIDVSWGIGDQPNVGGYVTPNNKQGDEIWFVRKNQVQSFVVAPYTGYEVDRVEINDVQIQPDAYTQGPAVVDQLQDATTADIKVENSPSTQMNGFGIISSDDSGSEPMSAMASASAPSTTSKTVSAIQPTQYTFTAAMLASGSFKQADNTLHAYFKTRNTPGGPGNGGGGGQQGKYWSIKTIVNGKGTVTASFDSSNGVYRVPDGSYPQFRFSPAAGYTVTQIKVNGRAINGVSNSYQWDTPVTSDQTLEVTFGSFSPANNSNRILRTLTSMAKTGDLTGPVVGAFLLIAALGLAITAVSYIRRNRLRRQMRNQRR